MMKTEDLENGSDVFVMLEALYENSIEEAKTKNTHVTSVPAGASEKEFAKARAANPYRVRLGKGKPAGAPADKVKEDIEESAMKAAIEDFMYSIPDAAIKDLKPVMKITNISRRFSEITKVLRKHGFPTMSKTLGSNSSNIINDYYDTFFGESVEEETEVSEAKIKYLTGPGKRDSKRIIGIYTMQGKWIKDMKTEKEAMNFVNKSWGESVEEEIEVSEQFKAGDKVKVPHKGKMVSGKIVRFDDGGTSKAQQHGGGYVVDVGEPTSILVPKQKVQKEETESVEEEEELDEVEVDEEITPARQAIIDREKEKASKALNKGKTAAERDRGYVRGSRINYLELVHKYGRKSDTQGSPYQVNKRELNKWRKAEHGMREEIELDEAEWGGGFETSREAQAKVQAGLRADAKKRQALILSALQQVIDGKMSKPSFKKLTGSSFQDIMSLPFYSKKVKMKKEEVESVEEAYAHPDEKVIGSFYEKTGKKAFEYRMSKDSWGKSHDLPHEVCVSRKDPSSKGDWRAANVKGTVCYIAVDEGEGGKPVIEKWDIKKHVKYVKAD